MEVFSISFPHGQSPAMQAACSTRRDMTAFEPKLEAFQKYNQVVSSA